MPINKETKPNLSLTDNVAFELSYNRQNIRKTRMSLGLSDV